MPRRPKRPCSYPGCPELTDGRYCERHRKEESRRYERYDRDKGSRKNYGSAWKLIRAGYAAEHPLCELCLAEGRYVRTEDVHHKLPLREGGSNDRSNLIALCKSCHNRIHAKRGDRWRSRKTPRGDLNP